jgi:hypothetical protein
VGKPRRLQGLCLQVFALFARLFMWFWAGLSLGMADWTTLLRKVAHRTTMASCISTEFE